jgi:hypothetical protein
LTEFLKFFLKVVDENSQEGVEEIPIVDVKKVLRVVD